MTDRDAIKYIRELMEFNMNGKLLTPKNENLGYDTFYQCAFEHAIRALEERAERHERDKDTDTGCFIGVINRDGTVDLSRCGQNGEPERMVPLLLRHYDYKYAAMALVSLGNLERLGARLRPAGKSHSFHEPEKGTTVAHYRDRGDGWETCKPKRYLDKEQALSRCRTGTTLYLYDTVKRQ